jgi:hypothetical protein
MEEPVKFSTLYTGAPYVPTVAAAAAVDGNGASPYSGPKRPLVREFTAVPIRDEALTS